MKAVENIAISASAGSGKTFQLAHRYIRLMAGGVPPERIAALTFSRKAAGEIFDSIVGHLCLASGSSKEARAVAERIEMPELGPPEFLRLLREVLDHIHRLHISTLDSFTVGVVCTFPMELGVATALDIMDNEGEAARAARREVLARIFNPHHHVDPKAQGAFREAFKQATFGQEEKTLGRSLETFFGEYQRHYHILPDADAWGTEQSIWPGGSPWLRPPARVNEAADQLTKSVLAAGYPEEATERWTSFIEAARVYAVGSPWVRPVEYMVEKLLAVHAELQSGSAEVKLNRTACRLEGQAAKSTLTLLARVMHVEVESVLERTRGIYRILAQYETFYDELVRRRGRLTFDDAQYLLTPGNPHSRGAVLSRQAGEEARLYIDYRLDSKLDHWLLDEFQDTSDLQWEVLRNLADEVLQDTSGERSFFYVGDVKQAIYGWRGGNARLFGRILNQYRGRIEERPLNTSFRSCPAVIDAVNQAFDALSADDGLPVAAVDEWNSLWHQHISAPHLRKQPGYVTILEPDCHGGSCKPDAEDRYEQVAGVIKDVHPTGRGLSVAVLVRTNRAGKAVVDVLRRSCRGVPVVHEGRAAIKDNPVVAALLALVQFAAHPGDTLSWRHLEMSPLRRCFEEDGLGREQLPLVLLERLGADGYQEFLRYWGRRLEDVCPLDDFGRRRLEQLVEAAGEFDARGDREVHMFLSYIEGYELHEPTVENAVRVMTIHQAKGLGFDMVILPDLQDGSITGSGHVDVVTARDAETNQPEWILKMPRRKVAVGDDVLSEQLDMADAATCFDELCVLYVAMTRARRAVYVVTSFPGKSSHAVTGATLLKARFNGDPRPTNGERVEFGGQDAVCLYEAGERDWFAREQPGEEAEPVPAVELPEDFGTRTSGRTRLNPVSPSRRAEEEEDAGLLFTERLGDSLEFGTAIHQLFEQVTWADESHLDDLIAEWRATAPYTEELKHRVVGQFQHALTSDEVRDRLSKPEGDVDLWRERAFEVVVEKEWVTGVFDRVEVRRAADGLPASAVILDYKSNDVETDEEVRHAVDHYRPQLDLYARALSLMLGLPLASIRRQLLFTRPGRVVEL